MLTFRILNSCIWRIYQAVSNINTSISMNIITTTEMVKRGQDRERMNIITIQDKRKVVRAKLK
jgi:hypothetical protein